MSNSQYYTIIVALAVIAAILYSMLAELYKVIVILEAVAK